MVSSRLFDTSLDDVDGNLSNKGTDAEAMEHQSYFKSRIILASRKHVKVVYGLDDRKNERLILMVQSQS